MMYKKWVPFAILLGISAYPLWLLTCYLTRLLPNELSPIALMLCPHSGPQENAKIPFCPNYVSLDTTNLTIPPYPLDTLPPNDYSTLINLKDFKFLNHLDCGLNASLLIAVVHSAPANSDKRQVIRSTWGTRIKTFFMIGQPSSTKVALKLDQEIIKFGDIVQGSFADSYRNLTYKHVMALKWVSYWCRNATYILKADDDVFVHAGNLYKFLRQTLSRRGVRRLILCQVHRPARERAVPRTLWNKHRVTRNEYAEEYFPYFCAGAAIVYSPDVVFELYAKTQQARYFWIDDVHITGTVAGSASIVISDIGDLFQWQDPCQRMNRRGKLMEGLLFCLTSYPGTIEDLWKLHNLVQPSFVINERL